MTLCLCDSQPWNCTHSPGPLIISGRHCPRPVSTVNKLHGVSMVPCFSPYTLTWEISSNSHSCNVHFSTANSQQSILSLTCLQVPAWLPDNSPKLKLMIATQVCSVAVGFTSCFCMTSLKPTITFIGIQNDFHFPPSFHLDSRRGGPILFLVTFDFIPFLAQSPLSHTGIFAPIISSLLWVFDLTVSPVSPFFSQQACSPRPPLHSKNDLPFNLDSPIRGLICLHLLSALHYPQFSPHYDQAPTPTPPRMPCS